jgi:hypothetical protein
MSISSDAKVILTQFTRKVWSKGNIEASDKYIAPKYTIVTILAIHGKIRNLTSQGTRSM